MHDNVPPPLRSVVVLAFYETIARTWDLMAVGDATLVRWWPDLVQAIDHGCNSSWLAMHAQHISVSRSSMEPSSTCAGRLETLYVQRVCDIILVESFFAPPAECDGMTIQVFPDRRAAEVLRQISTIDSLNFCTCRTQKKQQQQPLRRSQRYLVVKMTFGPILAEPYTRRLKEF